MKSLLNLSIVGILLITIGCVSTQHVLTGKVHPVISPDGVQVYSIAPTNSEIIGIVSTTGHPGWTKQQAVDNAICGLKKEAATLGANGLVLSEAMAAYGVGGVAQATAIFVPQFGEKLDFTLHLCVYFFFR